MARAKQSADPTAAAVALAIPATGRKLQPRAITPEYVTALQAYSKVLYDGGLTPKGAKRPESVAALIEIGRDVGLPATMAVSWIMVLNGRPSIWGDAAMALIRSSGLLESVREWTEGEFGTDEYTACFELKRVGAAEPRVTKFSWADAERANLTTKPGPWQEYPTRQLMWRAKSWGCRDEFPDVLCGLIFVEEARDMPRTVSTWTVEEDTAAPPAIATTATPPALPPASPPPVAPPTIAPPSSTSNPGPTPGAPETFAGHEGESVRVEITDTQLEEIMRLRALFFNSRGIVDGDERSAPEWAEFVFVNTAPNSVRKASHLTAPQADAFTVRIGEQLDPFTYPPRKAG